MTDKGNTILIVEDEAITAMTIKMFFTEKGYKVSRIVVTGEEAIQAAISDKPDIILMDITLAGHISGIEAARSILESIKVFIIFVSGYDFDDIKEKIKCLHPLAFFPKPLDLEDIREKIESVL